MLKQQATPSRVVQVGLLAWLAMLGVDFFLHAGLLARLYQRESPFLLSPEAAFRLIPLGYLSFLLLAALLLYLVRRLKILGARAGFLFGLQLGLLAWGALMLGLLSIATADLDLLVGWWLGQAVEMGVAGAVMGVGLERKKIGRLALGVIGLVVLLLILTIILQNVGLAPAVRI